MIFLKCYIFCISAVPFPESPRLARFPTLPDMSPKKVSATRNVYVSPLRTSKVCVKNDLLYIVKLPCVDHLTLNCYTSLLINVIDHFRWILCFLQAPRAITRVSGRVPTHSRALPRT
jgi:hypothetical protein